MAYKILVTGERDWTDRDQVCVALSDLLRRLNTNDVVIIHGACPTGVDSFVKEFCEENGIEQDPHQADWNKYGSFAGPKRNGNMVRRNPNICLAFWSGRIEKSGTFDCMRQANGAKVRVIIYPKMD